MYSTYNCSGYTNTTEPFEVWTSRCKAGPIAKSASEQEILSAAKDCSTNMTTDVPLSGELARFSVECRRREGFETETADIPFGAALFQIALLGGSGAFFYYPVLSWVYYEVRKIVSGAVSHVKSCSSCSLDAAFGSSDHLPLVQFQLIKDSVRSQLVIQTILAPLFVALFVATPSLFTGSNWPIIVLPCLLMWSHSIIGLMCFQSLLRKAVALRLTSYASWRLHDAAAINAEYEKERKKQSFW